VNKVSFSSIFNVFAIVFLSAFISTAFAEGFVTIHNATDCECNLTDRSRTPDCSIKDNPFTVYTFKRIGGGSFELADEIPFGESGVAPIYDGGSISVGYSMDTDYNSQSDTYYPVHHDGDEYYAIKLLANGRFFGVWTFTEETYSYCSR